MKTNFFLLLGLVPLLAFAQPDAAKVHQLYQQRLHDFPRLKTSLQQTAAALPANQRPAFEFLYAYMPLNDLADYEPAFFKQQLATAFKAAEYFAWGKTVPNNLFYHFVLPPRVNTENMDTARQVFFRQLKDRIKNLSMYDAVLEVNHWCHEQVSYRAADMRTSGPLATVRTSYGRCGEESTFTVAALRAVGIPARQVYTPRWAHSDDNHAWVEAWVDGKWYFLGACEPEPELNMGWFAGPALRAMMLHTNVFGQYTGPEEVMVADPLYTKINLMPQYAPTKKLWVKVMDENGKPAVGATVKFKLYNYAEFYTLSERITDAHGLASMVTGLGDVVVWANDGHGRAFEKVTGENTDTLKLYLQATSTPLANSNWDLVPPVVRAVTAGTTQGAEHCKQRLAIEDSLLAAYRGSFRDSAYAVQFAQRHQLDAQPVWEYLKLSHGNYPEIETYLATAAAGQKTLALHLLQTLSHKDLRDVPASVLLDLLNESTRFQTGNDYTLFRDYILAPRIAYELLTPYKSFIRTYFDADFVAKAQADPLSVMQWINEHISLNTIANYYHVPITPIGTLKLGSADAHSRNILFVAICRSFGIAARLEPATKVPEYFRGTTWLPAITAETSAAQQGPKAILTLTNASTTAVREPIYSTHYSLARFQNGDYETLDYETDESLKTFPCTLQVEPGDYMLVTGNRTNSGAVLSHVSYFTLKAGTRHSLEIFVRPLNVKPSIKGRLELPSLGLTNQQGQKLDLTSPPQTDWMVYLVVQTGKEPTNHALVDLTAMKQTLAENKVAFTYLFSDFAQNEAQFAKQYEGYPVGAFAYDAQQNLAKALATDAQQNLSGALPLVVLCDRMGHVYFVSEGYSIGLGVQLLKNIQLLRDTIK